MIQMQEFLQKVTNGEIESEHASEIFTQFSKEEKSKILAILEQRSRAKEMGAASHAEMAKKDLKIRTNQNCTEKQIEFVKEFVARRQKDTLQSKRLAEKYVLPLADQRRPANFNILLKEIHYPLTIRTAKGAYIEDIDGNRYVDIAGDFGVNLFGHAPDFLQSALKQQIDNGWSLSGRYETLGEASELFCRLTGNERVAFCQSGTESVMCAVRLARAFTDRQKVALFSNSYHGHADSFLNPFMPGVSEASARDIVTLTYGQDDAFEEIERNAEDLAAVLVEPVQSETVNFHPADFLRKLRDLTTRLGIVLVFDEMITGFRAHVSGCQGYFGVKADLATYGKILGGGLTAGAVAGRSDIMDWSDGGAWSYGNDAKPGPAAYIAGTHTQNPIKMAATLAVLKKVELESPELQADLTAKTSDLVNRINQFAKRKNLPFEAISFCSQFKFRFRARQFTLAQALFLHLLQDRGVNYHLHGNCFLTTAHTEKDVEYIFDAVCDSLNTLLARGFFYEADSDDLSPSLEVVDIDNWPVARSRTNETAAGRPLQKPGVGGGETRTEPDIAPTPISKDVHRAPVDGAQITADLKEMIGAFLELDAEDFSIEDELSDLGVDSIIMTGILKAVSDRFGVKLTMKTLEGAETLSDVGAVLARELGETRLPDAVGNRRPERPISPDVSGNSYPVDGQTDRVRAAANKEGVHIEPQKMSAGGVGVIESELDDILSRVREQNTESDEIAIVGMSAVFPGAENVPEYWRNLVSKTVSVDEVPTSRWVWNETLDAEQQQQRSGLRWGAFIEGEGNFDPLFFSISPREAKYMDPQERLLLMNAYRALEDAGLKVSDLAGQSGGVFVGYEYTDYAEHMRIAGNQMPNLDLSLCDLSGRPWNLANRLSFVFDWTGPSEAVNTNCASSAVSINRACQSLNAGESEVAIAGGVCLNLMPSSYSHVEDLLAPDGRMRIFQQGAEGYVKGEGCGVVILKRLSDAVRDNNPIYAVIEKTSQTYRGTGNSMSEVKSTAIKDLTTHVCDDAGINVQQITYFEVNGYGTAAGDQAEFEGICDALTSSQPCERKHRVGSVKGNIGHLEPASGVASLIKVALSMKQGEIPATVLEEQSAVAPYLSSPESPLQILDHSAPLDELRVSADTPVRVAINSFADSGANVQILVKEMPRKDTSISSDEDDCLFVLSAKNSSALSAYLQKWISFLKSNPNTDFAQLCRTSQVGREAYRNRLAVIAGNLEQLRRHLTDAAEGVFSERVFQTERGPEKDVIEAPKPWSDLKEIAHWWVMGGEVKWNEVPGARPELQTLHLLPTYPFNLKRYWAEAEQNSETTSHEKADEVRQKTPLGLADSEQSTGIPSRGDMEAHNSTPAESAEVLGKNNGRPVGAGDLNSKGLTKLDVLRKLRGIVLEFLEIQGTDEIDERANFSEIGLTSISIVLLIDEINQEFGLDMPEIVVFDYPNIVELTDYILSLKGAAESNGSENPEQPLEIDEKQDDSEIDLVLAQIKDRTLSIEDAADQIGRTA